MKVAIIGGGAIGLLTASLLSKNGIASVVYCRTVQQAALLREKGLLYRKEVTETISLKALPISEMKYTEDVMMVCVKQPSLHALQDMFFDQRTKGKTFLFLQNGMSHVRMMNQLADAGRTVWAGVAEHGVWKEGERTVRHTGVGRLRLAPVSLKGDNPWRELFGGKSIIEILDDYLPMLSEKLIINASINPVTALFRVRNGKLLENPHFRWIMKELFKEAVCVLGMVEHKERLLEDLYRICRNTSDNRSSMLRDIESKRKSEIESISGYIIEIARQEGIQTPATVMVFEGIKGMEWEG
ncbi:ketopantoate reductase family protein [Fictibacillus iocasae]|uniref:2-dehydropantoate 2-reductase n=1 Tax=Fictibacillus iocasae TaxID=2715437 RepID=A0ABW2NRU3_9BACL